MSKQINQIKFIINYKNQSKRKKIKRNNLQKQKNRKGIYKKK